MSVIAFLMDNREGHIIPSFKLAHDLKDKGHVVYYLSIMDNEKMVRDQGFEFAAVFEELYQEGFSEANKTSKDIDTYNNTTTKTHLTGIMDGALDSFFSGIKPDVLIVSVFLKVEILLLHYKYKVFPVMLNPILRRPGVSFLDECTNALTELRGGMANQLLDFILGLGVRFASLQDLLKPAVEFHEIILCPRAFDMDATQIDARTHYIGPSIRQGGTLGDGPDLGAITEGRKLLYASLGSYTLAYGEMSRCFFQTILAVMAHPDLQDFHLILSVSRGFDVSGLPPAPKNVTIVRWIDQIEVLKACSLAITHGGLGTIKECIYHGVPMVVFPVQYDQFRNAGLVDRHRMGVIANTNTISEEALRKDILSVLNSEEIDGNIKKMKALFHREEAARQGVDIIEQLI